MNSDVENFIIQFSGEDCQRLARKLLLHRDQAKLEPLIRELSELMVGKASTCEKIAAPMIHQHWPKGERSDEEVRWIADTYAKYFNELSC